MSAPDRTRDHLANERTLLAWVRTGVTLIGLGFVVARFSYFLRTLAAESHQTAPAGTGSGTLLGVLIVLGGGAMIGLALARFITARGQIDRGDYRSGVLALVLIGTLTIAAALVLAIFIGLTNRVG